MAIPSTATVFLNQTDRSTEKAVLCTVACVGPMCLENGILDVQMWLPKSALISQEASDGDWCKTVVAFWIAEKWNREYQLVSGDEPTRKYLAWKGQAYRRGAKGMIYSGPKRKPAPVAKVQPISLAPIFEDA